MKPYHAYKNASLPWLERIPAGWDALPNIALFDERIERGFISEELLSVTQDRGIIKQAESEEKDSSNEDKSAYKKVRVGDIAYNKMRMWQGAVGHSPFEGIVSPAYIVLKPKRRINPRFYHYLFRTPAYMRESYRNSYGICDDQLSLRFFNFKRMQSIIPPIDEQDAIVKFLEAGERDAQKFVANKRRTVELLKEQRTALINRVVTRGFDPNAPLRPSGIPWLGDIPTHWKLIAIRDLGTISGGMTPNRATAHFWGGDIPWVSPKDMKSKWIDGSLDRLQKRALDETSLKLYPPNSILFVVRGMILLHTLPVGINRVPVTVNQDMKVLQPKGDYLPEFIHASMTGMNHSLLKFVEESAHGTRCLRSSHFFPAQLPMPPTTGEQQAIIDYVNATNAKIEQAVQAAEREIELMREYRTALIAAAVTGKMDVRQASIEGAAERHPNRHFARALLSAEIVHQLHIEPTFGRIKHQKILHLCEFIGGIEEIQGEYHREAAGPLDNKLIYSVETELKKQKWFEEYKREQFGHGYRPLAKAGGHRTYVERYWKDKLPIIERLIKLMRTWDTERCEIFSTAYAAWNDLLIWRKPVTDDAIVHEILNRWHDRKRQVPESRWRKALDWMRKEGYVPTGFGRPTAKCATEAE